MSFTDASRILRPLLAEIIFARPDWLPVAAAIVAVVWSVMAFGLWRSLRQRSPAIAGSTFTPPVRRGSRSWLMLATLAKAGGVALLGLCLAQPQLVRDEPIPQANQIAIALDASASMRIGQSETQQRLRSELLAADSDWQRRLADDFDVRRYKIDSSLQTVADFEAVPFDGEQSQLATALIELLRQYAGRPLAAIYLLTDGNLTDRSELEALTARFADKDASLPAIYPVTMRQADDLTDVAVETPLVHVSDFESSPVRIESEVVAYGLAGEKASVSLLHVAPEAATIDDAALPRFDITLGEDGRPVPISLTLEKLPPGLQAFRLAVRLTSESQPNGQPVGDIVTPTIANVSSATREATLDNNASTFWVRRGHGPYRVLYIAGRPNWEFKFIRRALEGDKEIDLVGLIRIAKKQAKFAFGDRNVESNSLFAGFDEETAETAEQVDEPVYTRLGVEDADELRGGFPDDAEELFAFDAVILDDLETNALTLAQQNLLRRFCSQRGGTVWMLGGAESFRGKSFDRSPLAAMVPYYFDDDAAGASQPAVRWELTREGWLEPALRLAAEDADEQQRIDAMPPFRHANVPVARKPGAVVYARGEDADAGNGLLAVQRFGAGRAAALLTGDLWRWAIRYDPQEQSEASFTAYLTSRLGREDEYDPNANPALVAWRQMTRWLLADIPRRVSVQAAVDPSDSSTWMIEVDVKTAEFAPDDLARVQLEMISPEGQSQKLTAEPTETSGRYAATVRPQASGPWRIIATCQNESSEPIGSDEVGLVVDPLAQEMACLQPDTEVLEQIARKSGGRLLSPDQVDASIASLREQPSLRTVRRSSELWHQWWYLTLALSLIASEWLVRRWSLR